MYVLVELRDNVQIESARLHLPTNEVVEELLNRKYCNRVVAQEGLGVCVHSLVSVGAARLHTGNSSGHVRVQFRLVVFHPFPSEVLEGYIYQQDHTGILLSLGLTVAVFVRGDELPEGCRFHPNLGRWIWHYDEDTMLHLEPAKFFRVKVLRVEFAQNRIQPVEGAPVKDDAGEILDLNDKSCQNQARLNPFRIICSARGDGYGHVNWWNTEEEDGDDEDPEAAEVATTNGAEAADTGDLEMGGQD